jgi:hypothetical protein
LYYLQSRYYNPEWGRFINADVILGSAGELLSHNVFSYCSSNPIIYKDPSGLIRVLDHEGGGVSSIGGAAPGVSLGLIEAVKQVGQTIEKSGQAIQKWSGRVISRINKGEVNTAIKKIDGLNFANTPAKHMENPGRFVPVQTLQDVIKSTKGVPDPGGSNAFMHLLLCIKMIRYIILKYYTIKQVIQFIILNIQGKQLATCQQFRNRRL